MPYTKLMNTVRRVSAWLLLLSIAILGVLLVKHDTFFDWIALRNYTPPTEIVAFADATAMTDRAKHLLYINHPLLDGRTAFNKHCTNQAEQSVVLGCYLGNRNGIFIYNVTDAELAGVREVTTAHEMLHQAYDRLPSDERERINALLESYSNKQLSDEAIKKQVALYQKTEPDALPNELHSLFGTQVANLPDELEAYYKQYFSDRTKVVQLYQSYQAAFTTRKAKIAAYDAQLAQQKSTIESLQASLEAQLADLDEAKANLDAYRAAGDTTVYNSLVPGYNSKVSAYNAQLAELKDRIQTYNEIVGARNAIADQEQALQRSLSSKSLPDTAQE